MVYPLIIFLVLLILTALRNAIGNQQIIKPDQMWVGFNLCACGLYSLCYGNRGWSEKGVHDFVV